jgi:hypothetical protein
MNRIPTFGAVRAELEQLTPLVHRALASGASESRDFFLRQKSKIDSQLAAHIARWAAKKYLVSEGESVEDLESEFLALSGLALLHKRYHVRILRSDNGRAPAPGPSLPRQAFYCQQMSLLGPNVPTDGQEAGRLNVLYLWGTDRDYVPNELRLCCPQSGGETRDSVREYWNESVFDPALLIRAVPPPALASKPADLEFEPLPSKANKVDRRK